MSTSHTPPANVESRLDRADSLCAARGKRLTPVRRKVLELLLRHGRSLKAYELLDAIRTEHQGAAPPTVYRALDFLVEEGLVHRLDAVNAWIACLDAGGTPHNLLAVCVHCGAVAEISDTTIGRMLGERMQQAGYCLAADEMEIRAICPACRQREGLTDAPGHHHHSHA